MFIAFVPWTGGFCQTFELQDSLSVHGITFVGAVEGSLYKLAEPILVRLSARNHGEESIEWPFEEKCAAVQLIESWCTVDEDSCAAVSPDGVCILREGNAVFPPGEVVLAEYSLASHYPGDGWTFGTGRVAFRNPWNYPFPFQFYLEYTRHPTTVADEITWTNLKRVYR
jgi:hypothetical protein